ncbi:MAG: VOC family protein [Phycisphaerae bacterium]
MPNPICHFEFMAGDPERFKAFYGAVFDWQFDDASLPGYTVINPGAEPHGGMMPKPDQAPNPALNVYFHVDDIDATLKTAQQHGATVLVPKTPIPNVGWFAMFADPDGIPVGLLKPS